MQHTHTAHLCFWHTHTDAGDFGAGADVLQGPAGPCLRRNRALLRRYVIGGGLPIYVHYTTNLRAIIYVNMYLLRTQTLPALNWPSLSQMLRVCSATLLARIHCCIMHSVSTSSVPPRSFLTHVPSPSSHTPHLTPPAHTQRPPTKSPTPTKPPAATRKLPPPTTNTAGAAGLRTLLGSAWPLTTWRR